MEFISSVLAFCAAHYSNVAEIGFAVIALATLIVRLTPTTKDDEAVAFASKALNWLVDFLSNFSTANKRGHVEVHADDVKTVLKSVPVEYPSKPDESPK